MKQKSKTCVLANEHFSMTSRPRFLWCRRPACQENAGEMPAPQRQIVQVIYARLLVSRETAGKSSGHYPFRQRIVTQSFQCHNEPYGNDFRSLAIAVGHHQAGRLQAAEQIYRQVLAVEPDQPEAWHLLGVIAGQVGKHDAAVECIGRAIALKGTEAVFHNSLGRSVRAWGNRTRRPPAIGGHWN